MASQSDPAGVPVRQRPGGIWVQFVQVLLDQALLVDDQMRGDRQDVRDGTRGAEAS